MVEQAIEADLDASVFTVDESEIEWCSNVVEWVTEPKFLNASNPPFPKQMQWMLQLFEDYCPVCSDYEYIQDVPVGSTFDELLDRVQPLKFGVCPKCKKNRFDFKALGYFHFPNEINVCAGMRSGKTACAGMITSYHIHRFLQIPTPAKAFGLLTAKQTLYGTFTATTAGQAEQTLWKAFKDLVDGSTWYQEYLSFLYDKGTRMGLELYREGDTFVYFVGKRIYLTFAPADMKKLRGRTRLVAGIDEVGWMDDNPNRITANADETYEALIKSLRTVRSGAEEQRKRGNFNVPDGLMLNISSPCAASDKIMRLVEESAKDPRRIWDHVSTWEANPTIKQEHLASEKRQNYVAWLRDYGAIPPMAHNPFIPSEQGVLKLADKTIIAPATMEYGVMQDDAGGDGYYVTGRVMSCVKDKGCPRILTIDAGESYCSFAGTLCRYDMESDRGICDMIFEVIPLHDDKTGTWPVHFPTVFHKVIERFCEDLNIIHVVFDRWNSTQMIHELRMHTRTRRAVEAEKFTLKWPDFVNFRARVMQGNWRFPYPEMELLERSDMMDSIIARKRRRLNIDDASELQRMAEALKNLPLGHAEELQKVPNAHLLRQLLTVKELGRKVLKPSNDQDDIFRCLCLADRFIFDNRELYEWDGVAGHMIKNQRSQGVASVQFAGRHHQRSASGSHTVIRHSTARGGNETDIRRRGRISRRGGGFFPY
jgi:hypothetical protein